MKVTLAALALGLLVVLGLADRTGERAVRAPVATPAAAVATIPAPAATAAPTAAPRRARRRPRTRRAATVPPVPDLVGIRYVRGGNGGARVHGYVWGWDWSPSLSAIALGASGRGRIQIVATRPVAFSRIVRTGRREHIRALRWLPGDRMVALGGTAGATADALDLDLATNAIARHRLQGRDARVAAWDEGLVVLLDPPRGRTARLALIRSGAPPRQIEVPGVLARGRGRDHRTHVVSVPAGRRVNVLPFTNLPQLLPIGP